MIARIKQWFKRIQNRRALKEIRKYRKFLEESSLEPEVKEAAMRDTYVGEQLVLQGQLSYSSVKSAIVATKLLILATEALTSAEGKNTGHLQVVEQEEE